MSKIISWKWVVLCSKLLEAIHEINNSACVYSIETIPTKSDFNLWSVQCL
jgi:hypothetical protein